MEPIYPEVIQLFYNTLDKEVQKFPTKAAYYDHYFGEKSRQEFSNIAQSRRKNVLPSKTNLRIVLKDWEDLLLAEGFWQLKCTGEVSGILEAFSDKKNFYLTLEMTPEARLTQRKRRRIKRELGIW